MRDATATGALITRFRGLTPSGRCDMHAWLAREHGRGFADAFRDLVESNELLERNTDASRAAARRAS